MTELDRLMERIKNTCADKAAVVLSADEAMTLYHAINVLRAAVRDCEQSRSTDTGRGLFEATGSDTGLTAHYTVHTMLPTKSPGIEKPVTHAQVQVMGLTYPGLDIGQQLGEMRAWLLANPARRKTERGMMAFVNKWLKRAHENPRKKNVRSSSDREYMERSVDDFTIGD